MKLRFLFSMTLVALCCNAIAQPAVGSWSDTGPVLFPVNVSGQVNGMGRVCQVKFHATNPMKMYAVSASGGLFITTNNGVAWAPTPGTEQMPTTQCSSVCVDYTNDNIIYLSTGDQNYYSDDYGIWKSTDGGNTFNPANTNIGNRMAIEIIMDPANHNNLIAATDDGIWKTTNAGATWTETFVGSNFKSMQLKPGSTQILYAATGSDFYRSSDMGSTWAHITSGVIVPTGNQGIRIAVTPADTNAVFLGTTDGYGEILKSTDGGLTFTNIYTSSTQCIVCYDSTITSGSQGYYNFNLTVNPANANELLLVSHCVWRSTDGGLTWSWRTQWYNQVHTDMHDIEFNPYNLTQRFNANDGGVWMSTDTLATAWVPRSDGLAATEIYHAAQSPVVRQLVSIGSQDNGELYYDDIWKTNRGGDWGARCGFDYLGNGTVYYDNGNRRNLLPLGGDQPYNLSTTGSTFHIDFVPQLTNVAFIGSDSLWRSDNINTATPSWTLIHATHQNIQAIASCRADSNILYFATDGGNLLRSDNALSATPAFTALSAPGATNVMASIATDRHNSNVVFMSCNNNIYRSTDKGVNWTNISGTLPGLNILKVIADDYSVKQRLFVCEGSHVYYKDSTTTTWSTTTGMPTIPQFTDMMIYNDSTSASILRLSTYGRGVWECNIFNNLPPTGNFVANKQYLCPGDTVHYNKTLYGNFTSFLWSFPGGTPATSTADSPVVVYPTVGSYNATLTVFGTTGNDTVIKPAYIVVSNGTSGPLSEDFEETVFPPNPSWSQISQSGNLWQHSTACGGYGLSAHSMYFDNFDNDGTGHHDRIITPKIDLTTATSAYLTFDVAYSYYPGYHDSLTIDVSTDCGKTFTSVYEKDSTILATAPDTTGAFLPGPTQWRTDSISLAAYLGSHIQIAFDNIGHYGQNLYIDNINVGLTTTAVQQIQAEGDIVVFPNPAKDLVTVKATNLKANKVVIYCYNQLGALVTKQPEFVNKGILNASVNLLGLPTGVYALLIQCDNGNTYTKQVIVQ